MITSSLGSTTGSTIAKVQSFIPVVGPIAAAFTAFFDSLPTNPPCDPRTWGLTEQLKTLNEQQMRTGSSSMPGPYSLRQSIMDKIQQYESECRNGTAGTSEAYARCTKLTGLAQSQCMAQVTRELSLRTVGQQQMSMGPANIPAPKPFYQQPLFLAGAGAVAVLALVLALR